MTLALGYALLIGALVGTGRNLLLVASLLPVVLVLGLSAILYQFRLLVLTLPLLALTFPYIELPTGTFTRLPLSLVLALILTVVWLLTMLVRRSWLLVGSPLNRPLLAFGLVTVVSFGWSLVWRDPGLIHDSSFIVTQGGALLTILISLSAALLIGNFVTTSRQLWYIISCFLVFGTLMTLTQLFGIRQTVVNDRGLWATWLISCAYGLLIAHPKLRLRWRVVLAILVLLTFYQTLLVNSNWVSGWAPSLVAVAVITLLRSRRAFVALCLIGAVAFAFSEGFFAHVTQSNVDDGAMERLIIYEQSWRVLREHPLLGTGPAGYAIYYMTYFPEEARSTHNNYLDIIAQFGIVGMGFWLWVMGASMWEGWRLTARAPSGVLRSTVIIATGGWIAALASMLLGDWVLPFAYNQGIAGYKYTVYSWIFLGMLICVRGMLVMEDKQK